MPFKLKWVEQQPYLCSIKDYTCNILEFIINIIYTIGIYYLRFIFKIFIQILEIKLRKFFFSFCIQVLKINKERKFA